MGYVRLQVRKLNISRYVAKDVPEEAEEIAYIGDNEDQFYDLKQKADVDHRIYFVLIEHLVLCENRVVFRNLMKVVHVFFLDFRINSTCVENFGRSHESDSFNDVPMLKT